MNGLFIFIGESFRLGNQGTRKRGVFESYGEQINASESHIKFIEHISKKYNLMVYLQIPYPIHEFYLYTFASVVVLLSMF